MADTIRAAIIATIQSLFPVLQILGVISWTSDQIAIVMLFVTNIVTLLFLVIKPSTAVVAGVALGLFFIPLALSGSPHMTQAAVNCNVRHELRVDVVDLNRSPVGSLITSYGANVKLSPNPFTGLGTLVVVDNSPSDSSIVMGRIVISDACAGAYVVELGFDNVNLTCDSADTRETATNLLADALVTFEVVDCRVPVPTVTPTATATATSTATPAPTQTPVVVTATPTNTPQATATLVPVIVVTATPTSVPVVTVPAPVIRPPATGDAGMR